MSQITTHVLDTTTGKPGAGINVFLETESQDKWQQLTKGITDKDGRITNLLPAGMKIPPGIYRLKFDTKSYFNVKNVQGFYPCIIIEFEITDHSHYHVPLLLNPFGYSTYRGS